MRQTCSITDWKSSLQHDLIGFVVQFKFEAADIEKKKRLELVNQRNIEQKIKIHVLQKEY